MPAMVPPATRVAGLSQLLSNAYFTKKPTPSTSTTVPTTSISREPICDSNPESSSLFPGAAAGAAALAALGGGVAAGATGRGIAGGAVTADGGRIDASRGAAG